MAFPNRIDFDSLMELVCRRLLGEPNLRLTKLPNELRFGNHGSLSVNLTKGCFYDHESGVGGGVLDLIKHKMGCSHAEAISWLHSQNLLEERHPPSRKPSLRLNPPWRQSETIAAIYGYTDEYGGVLFQVMRYEPKKFTQRRPGTEARTYIWGLNAGEYMRRDCSADWVSFDEKRFTTWPPTKERATFDAVHRVLYRLPDLIKAIAGNETIYIVEGEKDADNLRTVGLAATTNAMGAGHWLPEYNESLRGADVVVIGDNDDTGREHVEQVAQALNGTAKRMRVLDHASVWPECPEKGDVSEWFAERRRAFDRERKRRASAKVPPAESQHAPPPPELRKKSSVVAKPFASNRGTRIPNNWVPDEKWLPSLVENNGVVP